MTVPLVGRYFAPSEQPSPNACGAAWALSLTPCSYWISLKRFSPALNVASSLATPLIKMKLVWSCA